jgi:hypothetical protein
MNTGMYTSLINVISQMFKLNHVFMMGNSIIMWTATITFPQRR